MWQSILKQNVYSSELMLVYREFFVFFKKKGKRFCKV